MSEESRSGTLDRLVKLLAQLMDAVGLNGRRLEWRWVQRRRQLAESGLRGEQYLKSARGKHKMCPSCRALIERSANSCSECQASLSEVSRPGPTRLLANLFPGITAASSLILLLNGFWFVMMLMAQLKTGDGGFSFDWPLLVRFGAGVSRYVPQLGTGGEWWRIITPIFLHGGILHFGFNSFVLIQLGPLTENIYGTPRFWVIYLTCGIAGSAASQLLRPTTTVGASGAILGLITLLLVYNWRHGGLFGDVKSMIMRLLFYMVVLSFFFNIDHINHAGGALAGALLGLVVPPRAPRSREERWLWDGLAVAGVLLVLLAFWNVARVASRT